MPSNVESHEGEEQSYTYHCKGLLLAGLALGVEFMIILLTLSIMV